MIKHTPGPWVTYPDGDYIYIQHEATGDGVNAPCGVFTVALVGYGFGMQADPEEAQANARLIAAAPKMLNALQSVLRALAIEGGHVPVVADARATARAAIAQAEGQKED